MSNSHVTSPQVCRPHHFHGPLSWLSDPTATASTSLTKPAIASSSGVSWGSPFACPQDPQDKLSQAMAMGVSGGSGQLGAAAAAGQLLGGGSSSGFSFPPTPPKDSTPDSVHTGPTEYQATINAFMQHQAQVTSNSLAAQQAAAVAAQDSCILDVKPCLTGNGSLGGSGLTGSSHSGGGGSGGTGSSGSVASVGGGGANGSGSSGSSNGQNQPKQREGTTLNGSVIGSASSGNNSALFDSSGHGSYGGHTTGYDTTAASYGSSYGHHQQSGSFHPNVSRATSGMTGGGGSHMKSASSQMMSTRTKARTTAGKIWTRVWVLWFCYCLEMI